MKLELSDAALANFEKTYSIDPRISLASVHISRIIRDKGMFTESEEVLRRALAVEKDYILIMNLAFC